MKSVASTSPRKRMKKTLVQRPREPLVKVHRTVLIDTRSIFSVNHKNIHNVGSVSKLTGLALLCKKAINDLNLSAYHRHKMNWR